MSKNRPRPLGKFWNDYRELRHHKKFRDLQGSLWQLMGEMDLVDKLHAIEQLMREFKNDNSHKGDV